jgi:RND family efflux transporter MFP subunit
MVSFGCGAKKKPAKNMEQIQKEQGIPVRVKAVELSTFNQVLSYNATLSGIEESTAQAMVSDIVVKINARVGDRVSKGQVIMNFPSNTPAAQYEQARTGFNAQKQVYERMQRLFTQGAISRQDMDNAETGYNVAKANLDASEQMINVRAPISGIITAIMVNPAEKVFPGTNLFTVSSTGGYKAVLNVPDTEVAKIKKGASATALVNGTSIQGKVSSISMAVDPNTKAIRVEATFSGMNREISYGSMARVDITVMSKPGVIVVERQHIAIENDKSYVWLNENNRAVRREIQTGENDKLNFEVISGLAIDDQLIVEGISQLAESALIRVVD